MSAASRLSDGTRTPNEQSLARDVAAGKKAAHDLFWNKATPHSVRSASPLPTQASSGSPSYQAAFKAMWQEQRAEYASLQAGSKVAPGPNSAMLSADNAFAQVQAEVRLRQLRQTAQSTTPANAPSARKSGENPRAAQQENARLKAERDRLEAALAAKTKSTRPSPPATSAAMARTPSNRGRSPSPPAGSATATPVPATPKLDTRLPSRTKGGSPISPIALADPTVSTVTASATGARGRGGSSSLARASIESLTNRARQAPVVPPRPQSRSRSPPRGAGNNAASGANMTTEERIAAYMAGKK